MKSFTPTSRTYLVTAIVTLSFGSLVGGQTQTGAPPTVITARDYDISMRIPHHWVALYPRGDRIVISVCNQTGGVKYGTVVLDIGVGIVGQEVRIESDASTKLAETFPGLTKKSAATVLVANRNVKLTIYLYHVRHPAGDYDGLVSEALLTRGNIYYDIILYGEKAAYTRSEHDLMEILRSIELPHPKWEASESQLAYLSAIENVKPRGNYPSVIELLKKAVELDPNNVKAQVILGLAYEYSQRPTEAAAQYKVVTKVDGCNPDAWLGLGTLAAWKGNKGEALECYLAAMKCAPLDYLSATKAAEYLTYAKRIDEALAAARKSRDLNRDQGPALDQLIGTLEYVQKRLTEEKLKGIVP